MNGSGKWFKSKTGAALACLLIGLSYNASVASPAQEARKAAQAAENNVTKLSRDLDTQIQAQQYAVQKMHNSISQSILDDQNSGFHSNAATQARYKQGRTARALYSSGGQTSIYLQAIATGDVSSWIDRAQMAQNVINAASNQSRQTQKLADAAVQKAGLSNADSKQQIVTVQDIIAANQQIEAILTKAQDELKSLSNKASQLEEAERAERELAAARARAALAMTGLDLNLPGSASQIPPIYKTYYQTAVQQICPTMRWTMLAAVGQVETGHGRNNGPSSAGAIGPMQFMPTTFAMYGIDGDNDGRADAWNAADAIYSAANYLCKSGANSDAGVTKALLAYNNAMWYVNLVLKTEVAIIDSGQAN